jgi:hypothetical protein
MTQGAVEFLLLAGSRDQAFDIAQAHQEMNTFARIIAAEATPDQYAKIAAHYENHGEYEKAADVCVIAQQHLKAVQLFLKVGPALDCARPWQAPQPPMRWHSSGCGIVRLPVAIATPVVCWHKYSASLHQIQYSAAIGMCPVQQMQSSPADRC